MAKSGKAGGLMIDSGAGRQEADVRSASVETRFLKDPAGRQVTVVGLGYFGGAVGAIRYLAARGCRVVVTDLKPEEKLGSALNRLKGCDVELRLGGHRERDFTDADLIVLSPAVPRSSRFVRLAEAAGVPISSEIRLFISQCPARRIVGITGSNGKTTTTSLLGSILNARAAAVERTYVGGNIGGSLLDVVDDVREDDVVVLELSSFQLEDLNALAFSPRVAVVTNLVPNHLDRHGDFASYRSAKETIVRHQHDGDTVILNADDAEIASFAALSSARPLWFSARPLEDGRAGTFVRNGSAMLRRTAGNAEVPLFELDRLRIPGRFNVLNALAAAAAASTLDVRPEEIAAGVARFQGVAHRLELVLDDGERRWFNDSKATTPAAAAAALEVFDGDRTVVLIAGGSDKKVPFDVLAGAAARRCRAVIVIGESAPMIRDALARVGCVEPVVMTADRLASAVTKARAAARPGDVVLLSPGCASYDMFSNFEERGDAFRRLVTRGSD